MLLDVAPGSLHPVAWKELDRVRLDSTEETTEGQQ
jgi:hypothetical protein